MSTFEEQIRDAETAKELDGKTVIGQLELMQTFCGLDENQIASMEADEVNKMTMQGIKRMQEYCERTKSTITLDLGQDKDGNPTTIQFTPDKDKNLLARAGEKKADARLTAKTGKDLLRNGARAAVRVKQKAERVIDKSVQEFGR